MPVKFHFLSFILSSGCDMAKKKSGKMIEISTTFFSQLKYSTVIISCEMLVCLVYEVVLSSVIKSSISTYDASETF